MSEAALFYKSDPGWPGPDMQMAFVHGDPRQVDNPERASVMVMLPGLVRLRLASPRSAGAAAHRSELSGVRIRFSAPDRWGKAVQAAVRNALLKRLGAVGGAARTGLSRRGPEGLCAPVRRVLPPPVRLVPHGPRRIGGGGSAAEGARYRGSAGLRVADAGVMPAVPSGNCHAGIVMIGEKAADLVKADCP